MLVKVVLLEKPKVDGTMPLCIRITRDLKLSYANLGYYVAEMDWDEIAQRVRKRKRYPNSTRLNNLLLKKLAEVTDTMFELKT